MNNSIWLTLQLFNCNIRNRNKIIKYLIIKQLNLWSRICLLIFPLQEFICTLRMSRELIGKAPAAERIWLAKFLNTLRLHESRCGRCAPRSAKYVAARSAFPYYIGQYSLACPEKPWKLSINTLIKDNQVLQ